MVHKEQVEMEWPGLARETKDICQELQIEDCNTTTQNSVTYKKIVTEAIQMKNENILLGLAENKSKCERMTSEKYGKKDYISKSLIADVRVWYKSRYGLLPFAGNYSKDQRFSKTNWFCRCGKKEKEIHLTTESCPIYSDIRAKYTNFEDDEDLVAYFQEVLDRRDRLDRLEADEMDMEED